MSRSFKIGVLAAAVMAVAPAAQAFEAGDFVVRGGAITVSPDASSSNLRTDLAALPEVPGATVDVDSDTQVGLRFSYMLTSELALGVLGATPFKHDIEGDGVLSSYGKLGETKQLPPTITLQYFPMPSSSDFQPYVGAGFNYTVFFEEDTTTNLDRAVDDAATNGAGAVQDTDLSLDDSFGLAAEVGMDYMFTENFGVNAAVWWIDIDTDAEIGVYDGTGNKIATGNLDVEIDPWVYMVGVSYKF